LSISIALLAASLASAVACGTLQVALLRDINRALGANSPFRYARRDVVGIFQEHRRLFPHSKLRKLFGISLALFTAFASALILLPHIR